MTWPNRRGNAEKSAEQGSVLCLDYRAVVIEKTGCHRAPSVDGRIRVEPKPRRTDHGAGAGEGSDRVAEIERVLRLIRGCAESLKQPLVDKSDRINLRSIHGAGIEV